MSVVTTLTDLTCRADGQLSDTRNDLSPLLYLFLR